MTPSQLAERTMDAGEECRAYLAKLLDDEPGRLMPRHGSVELILIADLVKRIAALEARLTQ